jgi:segregation and condensation protein B
MEASQQRRVIEALILASPDPVTLQRLVAIVAGLTPAVAKDRINELNAEYEAQSRAFDIWEVAGGFQVRTRAEFSGYVQQLRKDRPLRLSQAALESLAIVAYKQPLTRAELELVRGVDSGAVLRSLLDRRLLRLLGHREVPGRPLIYGTGKRFLEVFGLESLKELPSLRELEELAREQGVVLADQEAGESESAEETTESAEGTDVEAPDGVQAAEPGSWAEERGEAEEGAGLGGEPVVEAAGQNPLPDDGQASASDDGQTPASDDVLALASDDAPAEIARDTGNRPAPLTQAQRGNASPVAPE